MKTKVIAASAGSRVWVVVLEPGEEVMQALLEFAAGHEVTAASFVALGAFESATLGYFDWQRKEYLPIPVREQSEVVTLVGDIARGDDGAPSLHAHTVLGGRDASTRGGHLIQGRVRPTLEITVTETPAKLRRVQRKEFGIALIEPDA